MKSVEGRYFWQIVASNVVGPFLCSPRGNQCLFVVTDHFSKWVELFSLRKLVSQKTWDCLLEIFARFGFPTQLITDSASYFINKVFIDICKALGITHKRTSPHHPQSNVRERVNSNLMMMLIEHTVRHKNWDAKLPEMTFATRTTVDRSTGFTRDVLVLDEKLLSFGK